MKFIIGAKPDGNKALFEWVDSLPKKEIKEYEVKREETTHRFRYVNGAPLSNTHHNVEVNFLEYWELDKGGNTVTHFTWITGIFLTKLNVYEVMRGTRSQWHIENETFNTLKNQGYNCEHNYGHGYKNLNVVLAFLMMLAFTIDHAIEMGCGLFKAALKKLKRKAYVWRDLKSLFQQYNINSWEDPYSALVYGHKRES